MSAINLGVFKGDKPLLQSAQPVNGITMADLMASIKTVKEKSNEFLTELVNAEKTKLTERSEAEKLGKSHTNLQQSGRIIKL
jgi:FtsZ-binding cell division protein ZapB